ncbi:hypothetical protein QYM36_011056 [Artemia franciscana]|uniref:Uncharacterized protein n=1 Tax=Artemia franciscana TaxID=6661 RepID=A0AA88HRN9_ARTSF|nr:hypothetical protein QYM36_011056 [Artemia franciscana]
MSGNILEMIKLFQACDDDKVALLTFLIFEPEEVPSIQSESTVIVTRKVMEICNKLDILVEQNFSKPVTAEEPAEYISKPSYPAIVKNLPSNLTKPQSKKAFLEQACGDVSSKIVELKCTRGDWKVTTAFKCDAHAIENALRSLEVPLLLWLKVLLTLE